jgi:hypothetical protein
MLLYHEGVFDGVHAAKVGTPGVETFVTGTDAVDDRQALGVLAVAGAGQVASGGPAELFNRSISIAVITLGKRP